MDGLILLTCLFMFVIGIVVHKNLTEARDSNRIVTPPKPKPKPEPEKITILEKLMMEVENG